MKVGVSTIDMTRDDHFVTGARSSDWSEVHPTSDWSVSIPMQWHKFHSLGAICEFKKETEN